MAARCQPRTRQRSLSVRHENGWTCPRDVLEALEAIEDIPLPARCGMWQRDNRVGVEVVATHAIERLHTAA